MNDFTSTARVVEHRPDDSDDAFRSRGQFELWIDDEVISYANYSERDGVVTIPHVETAPRHRGNGRAAQLMDGVLDLLRQSGRTIVPLCSFAAGHVHGDERHHDLLAG